jgi:methionyl-tRNA formyltransferase
MRIVLIGQDAFGDKVLQAILEEGEEVAGVYTPPDRPGRPDPLKETAQERGIPIFQPKRMRQPEVYSEYVKLAPELNVMAFVTDILPLNILNYPELGTIQYHPSLLPKHRGGSAINWAIINGETKTGITIFCPDEGIDTGPIILQKEAEISPDDTVGSLYFNKLFPLGVEAIIESIRLIKQSRAPQIPQDESQAAYEGLCTEKEAYIDWSQPAQKVYNLIRGTNPQPGATTFYQGKRLKIYDSELFKGVANKPSGEVIEITRQGVAISAKGGAILVKRVLTEDAVKKISALEHSQSTNLKVGDRLPS